VREATGDELARSCTERAQEHGQAPTVRIHFFNGEILDSVGALRADAEWLEEGDSTQEAREDAFRPIDEEGRKVCSRRGGDLLEGRLADLKWSRGFARGGVAVDDGDQRTGDTSSSSGTDERDPGGSPAVPSRSPRIAPFQESPCSFAPFSSIAARLWTDR
jgi:hypothetical protein